MILSAEKIKSSLNFQAEVFCYKSIESTNDEAGKIAHNYDCPVLIAAESQTKGKGRNGRSFFSPDGGIYFSLITHPKSNFASLNTVTCGVSVGVTRAIKKLTDIDTKIKWVNDIYLDNKKICGILCKAVGGNGSINHLITGIGLNLSQVVFPDEIKNTAGALNCDVDKNIFIAEIVNNIYNITDYMDEYKEKSCVIGKEIFFWINGILHEGFAIDIDSDGGLIVVSDGKKSTLNGGEITVRVK